MRESALLAFIVATLISQSAWSQCDPEVLSWHRGRIEQVAAAGDVVFASSSYRGVYIFDSASLNHLQPIGYIETEYEVLELRVHSDYLLLTTADNTFAIFDVSQPETPLHLSSLNLAGQAHAIDAEGDLVVLGLRIDLAEQGLRVLDISDPSQPQEIGAAGGISYAVGIDVLGPQVAVADREQGLLFYNLSDPTLPTFVGAYTNLGLPLDVDMRDGTAFVCDRQLGFMSFDRSNPAAPQLLDTISLGNPVQCQLDEGVGYVVNSAVELLRVDVSDPANLNAIGAGYLSAGATDIDLQEATIFVAAAGNGLSSVEVPSTDGPRIPLIQDTPGRPESAAVDGSYLYVADGNQSGVLVYDVADPLNAIQIATIDPVGVEPIAVEVSAGLVFVADYREGLRIYDVSVPTAPVYVGGIDPGGVAFNLAVMADIAVMGTSDGLVSIDVSDPSTPQIVGSLSGGSSQSPRDMQAMGNELVVAWGSDGLNIVDVSDPTSPALLSNVHGPGNALSVATDGAIACVSDSLVGLLIYDIADRNSPILCELVEIPGGVTSVELVGRIACVGVSGGMIVIDVSDPNQPIVLAELSADASLYPMTTNDTFVYASLLTHGWAPVDIALPTGMRTIGSYRLPNDAVSTHIQGDLAYVADSEGGLQILDIQDPENPYTLGGWSGVFAYKVFVDGSLAYVAGNGIHVFDVSDPTRPIPVGYWLSPECRDVVVRDGIGYFACRRFYTVDVADVRNMVQLDWFSTAFAGTVVLHADTAFVADNERVHCIDISDPNDVTQLGQHSSLYKFNDLDVESNTVYALSGHSLEVLDVADPTNPTLVAEPDSSGGLSVAVSNGVAYVGTDNFAFGKVRMFDANPASSLELITTYELGHEVQGIDVRDEIAYLSGPAGGLLIADMSPCLLCPADWDASGLFNTADFIAYLNDYNSVRAGGSWAHRDPDIAPPASILNSADFIAYLNLYVTGCP